MTRDSRPDKIEILGESLIDDYPHHALDVLGYASKLGRQLGWHYVLDILWILKELKCPPGGTILDAGAGNGLIQFILASKGYRVISVDVSERKIPPFARDLYAIDLWQSDTDLEHPYLEWHRIDGSRKSEEFSDQNTQNPRIIYYHSRLDRMERIESHTVDAVVSVSAIEHNPPEDVRRIMSELQRVLKKQSDMYITISGGEESFFHEPSFSWIMNEADLAQCYGLDHNYQSNFNRFAELFKKLHNATRLNEWLAALYYRGEKNGMPWGKWDPQYQPVGILKKNR